MKKGTIRKITVTNGERITERKIYMYYKYQLVSEIADSIDAIDTLHFQIKLKENMNFIIGGCYFLIKKNHDYSFIISDKLIISCYSHNKNKKEATEKIRYALEYFIFLTGVPYETNGTVTESIEISLPSVDINLSKIKMLKIQDAENAYQRIRAKKKLLQNSLHLFSTGTRLNYLFNEIDCEDAFFTFFKIIENIVKDDFSIEKANISRGTSLTQEYLSSILNNSYNIQTTTERLLDICGKIENIIFDTVFDGIYHKIIWFSKKHNIAIDCNILSKIVNMRNKIAHGDKIVFEQCINEYKYTIDLTHKIILAKFFTSSLPTIQARIIVH